MTKLRINDGKVPFATKFWYGAADIYGGGAFNIINFYYAFFLTSVLKISPYWAGAIILISKIWDAISDPLMGRITDNTRSKYGRRRLYFILGIPFIFISFVILWFPVDFPELKMRVLYALISYMLFNTVNTMVMVPYHSMMPELSDDYNERSNISGIRTVFSLASSLVCALVPLMIVNSFDNIRTGYIIMSIAFGLFFSLPWIGTILFTKEREDFMHAPKRKGNFFKEYFNVFKIVSFRKFVLMYLCSFLALDVITTLFMFYMAFYLNAENMTNIILGTLIATQILAIPLATLISKRTSKHVTFMLGSVLWAICALLTLFIRPTMPIHFMFALAILMGIAIAMPIVMILSIFSDVTDVGELYYSRRMEGSFSGIQTFIRKACSAGAIALIMFGLGAAGFRESTESGVIIQQYESVILTIRLIIAFVPSLLLLLGAYIATTMPLTKSIHRKVVKFNALKRSGEEIPIEIQKEMDSYIGQL